MIYRATADDVKTFRESYELLIKSDIMVDRPLSATDTLGIMLDTALAAIKSLEENAERLRTHSLNLQAYISTLEARIAALETQLKRAAK
jgi:hypothetical protein